MTIMLIAGLGIAAIGIIIAVIVVMSIRPLDRDNRPRD
jgi:hypothetical protein